MELRVENLCVKYGAIEAIIDVSLSLVKRGEIISFIGCNGAGKSTFLRTISGLLRPTSGKIWFDGEQIDKLAPQTIAARGIAHVPEGRQLFPFMTTLDNIMLGGYLRKDRKQLANDLEAVYDLFPILRQRQNQMARTLSGGEQQMVAIGRGVMSNPRLLLLDELTMGLAPLVVEGLAETLQRIRSRGVSVILAEQNAYFALEVAGYINVFETGRLVLKGTPGELKDSELVKAYLGL